MRIVIPMAGKSERFSRAGYALPKMLLPVSGRSMIERVVELFDPRGDDYFFIVSSDFDARFGLSAFLSRLPISCSVAIIPSHDLGPLYSLLSVRDAIGFNEEVVVNYCDFLMEWDYAAFVGAARRGGYQGAIASFRGFHPASLGDTRYAYMRVDEKNELEALREKESFTENRIEEPTSTGTYYFQRWRDVVVFGEELMRVEASAAREYYPSMVYNLMCAAGQKSLVVEVKKFICLGTPKDYCEYQFWSEVFERGEARRGW